MKRFLIFAGLEYYPMGGWGDFYDSAETVEDALEKLAHAQCNDWWQIVDSTTGTVVKTKK